MGSLPGHSRAGRVPCSTQKPSLVSSLFLISGLPPPLAWAPPQAAPGDASLQGGAGRPQVPMQRRVGGRVPKADGQPPHQSSGAWPRPAPKSRGGDSPARGGCSRPSPATGTCPSWEAGTGPLGASVSSCRGSQEAAVGRGSCFQPPRRPPRMGPRAGRRPLAAGGTSPRPDASCPDLVLVPIRSPCCAGARRAAPRAWAAASHHHPGRSRTQRGRTPGPGPKARGSSCSSEGRARDRPPRF